MRLNIGYLYPEKLNLYGDNGNVEILKYRAQKRGIEVNIVYINLHDSLNDLVMDELNFVFMGGGPDSSQHGIYKDLIKNKGPYLADYINSGGVGLFICGSYQLLGNYYKSSDGSILDGLGVFDLYTEHFGNHKPRCIGNILCSLNNNILEDKSFPKPSFLQDALVGFENHGGRTYLGSDITPLGLVSAGYGNNGEDKTEGVHYKNSFGTYFHGPILAKNPHFADFLIAKSLGLVHLDALDDNIIYTAHRYAKNLCR